MRRLLAVVAAGSILLVACSSDSGGSSSGGSGSPSSSATESASPSGSLVPSGESPTPTPSVTESPTPSESPLPPLPPAVESPQHGGTYFGVYLAVGEARDPKLTTAVQEAAALGYRVFPGDISCDQGAAEALGVSNNLFAVAVYFERRGQANDLLPWLELPPLGVVKVRTYCAD